MGKKVTDEEFNELFNEPGEGMVDASASIPEVSETAIVDEDSVVIGNVSETFRKALPVFLSPVELGEYSAELARQCELLCDIEEKKKAANKAFGEQIKDIRKKMDHYTKIITGGVEDRLVECKYDFDFEHCVKTLIRLDTGDKVNEETITPEEMQADFNFAAEESIKNVEAFGTTYDLPDSNVEITEGVSPIGRFCQNFACGKYDAAVYGNCSEADSMDGCTDFTANDGMVPRPKDCTDDCVYTDRCPTTCKKAVGQ